jgi:hypothetical protein
MTDFEFYVSQERAPACTLGLKRSSKIVLYDYCHESESKMDHVEIHCGVAQHPGTLLCARRVAKRGYCCHVDKSNAKGKRQSEERELVFLQEEEEG